MHPTAILTTTPKFPPKMNNVSICTYPLSLLVSEIQSVIDGQRNEYCELYIYIRD
jgi:hypothetical protein